MSDQPQAKKVPIWVFVLVFLAVALVAGGVGWLLASCRPAPVVVDTSTMPTATVTATLTAEPTVTVVATPTVEPTSTPTNVTTKEPSLVTKMTGSASKGYKITVDYVQILTGDAAAAAATAAGEESPPPNDYFIVNSNPKLRTFAVSKKASITVLGWGSSDSTAKKKVSLATFKDLMPGGPGDPPDEYASAYYYITVKNGTTVTKIEQIFFP